MSDHSFNPFIAQKYDVNVAIFINSLVFWTRLNASNGSHYHDGRYWTYNTPEAMRKYFPYWSADQIRRIIKKMVNLNLIVKSNYNKKGYDRTNWYSLSDNVLIELNLDRTCLTTRASTHLAKSPDPFGEIARPIPVTNTVTKKDSSHCKNERSKKPVPSQTEVVKDEINNPCPEKPETVCHSSANADETNSLTKEAKKVIAIWNQHATKAGCPKVGENKKQLKAIQRNIKALKQNWEVIFTPETFEKMLTTAINNNFYLLTKYYQSLDIFLRWNNFEAAYLDIKGETK